MNETKPDHLNRLDEVAAWDADARRYVRQPND
jgi:hypothetical protein